MYDRKNLRSYLFVAYTKKCNLRTPTGLGWLSRAVFSNLYKKRPKLKNLLTIPIHATPKQIQNGSTTNLKC